MNEIGLNEKVHDYSYGEWKSKTTKEKHAIKKKLLIRMDEVDRDISE